LSVGLRELLVSVHHAAVVAAGLRRSAKLFARMSLFRRPRPPRQPATEEVLRCSFCNKTQRQVRKLIAGPAVHICDACVEVCVDIIADDRRLADRNRQQAPTNRWPASDAWCAFCGKVTALETALMIQDRTLLCETCIAAIAKAAAEAGKIKTDALD
jgi:hypothetical protein